MTPPGIPDFYIRYRSVDPGPVALYGRAWSGFAPIRSVEVTTDGGETWFDAVLDAQPDRYAWVGWHAEWHAELGEHLLGCRAADADGNQQPLEPEWNLGGYACNAVHCLRVIVETGS